jgi:hypothetical protein
MVAAAWMASARPAVVVEEDTDFRRRSRFCYRRSVSQRLAFAGGSVAGCATASGHEWGRGRLRLVVPRKAEKVVSRWL